MSAACRALRLMVSGSAALPVQTLVRWREITGHTLLERYGMTELGMALSNPLAGERQARVRGHAAAGCRGARRRRAGRAGSRRAPPEKSKSGAPNVFLEYWHRPDDTAAAFRDGWFRTGDTAIVEDGSYRHPGPEQRGHHQDRRFQGVGARDRRGAPDPPGHRRMRRRGNSR